MKPNYLTYILISIIALGFLMVSCDGDDSASSRNIEGHWTYLETKIDVSVTDPSLEKEVEEYMERNTNTFQCSYEFKNDKTFYYYVNYAEPLKGKYKMVDRNYVTLDDSRGIRKVISNDTIIYVIADMSGDVAHTLDIPQDKIVKANMIQVFERGLFPH